MTKYYLRKLRSGIDVREEFWCVKDNEAYRIDVMSSSGLSRFSREPCEEISRTLDKIAPSGDWHELSYEPGKYFPRMARPNSINEPSPGHNPDTSDECRYYRAKSTGQLHAFVEELDEICRVIHPEGDNLRTYGHATRNVLILACTEVEARGDQQGWSRLHLRDQGRVGSRGVGARSVALSRRGAPTARRQAG